MNKFKKTLLGFMLVFALLLSCSASAFAEIEKIYDNQGGVITISHRGNGTGRPANSLEAVMMSMWLGADMVSVNVKKTADDVLVLLEDGPLCSLCETDETEISKLTYKQASKLKLYNEDKTVSGFRIATLEEAIKNSSLIIDGGWEYRDEIASMAEKYEAQDRVFLRTNVGAKKIIEWKNESESKLSVIGIYSGNIVFNAISHFEKLSGIGEPLVQFQSKNYFNVMYDKFTAKRYSRGENARAIAPMYDKALCGQRNDNVVGWDEIVERGFSAIETNNISALVEYCEKNSDINEELSALVEKLSKTDLSPFSQVGVKKLEKELTLTKKLCENKNSPLGAKQAAYSSLLNMMENLVYGGENDTQKDVLNITAGKVSAIVIFGLLILAAQIYIYKMKKKKIR